MIFYITTMVLRDVRDTRTQKHIFQKLKTKAHAKWSKRNSKKRRKKNRIKTKKNTNKSITFPTKRQAIIQKKEVDEKKEVCSICCEETNNLKYINCKRGGVQNIKYGKYGNCCKDKPICKNCAVKCDYHCPFCKGHSLYCLKNKFKQKKASFAVKESRRKLKILKKQKRKKKKMPMLRVSVRRARPFQFPLAAYLMGDYI